MIVGPQTVRDWSTLAQDHEALLREAVTAGMLGRKAALGAMLRMLSSRSGASARLPIAANARAVDVASQEVIITGESRPSRLGVEQADLQMAVAMGLAFDTPSDRPCVDQTDAHFLAWRMPKSYRWLNAPGFERTRTTWTEEDEKLLQQAIKCWRPGGYLCAGADPQRDLARLMAMVGRHVRHPQAIHAFERAGIDLDTFAQWTVSLDDCNELRRDGAWVLEISKSLALPVAMVCQFNPQGAAVLLSGMNGPEARNIARQMIVDVLGAFGGRSAMNMLDTLHEAKFEGPGTTGRQELAQLLGQLERLYPGAMARAAQMVALDLALSCDDHQGRLPDPAYLEHALHVPSPVDGTTLAQVLAHWPVLVDGRQDTPGTWRTSVVKRLLLDAIQAHRHEVLEAGAELLQQAACSGELLGRPFPVHEVVSRLGNLPEKKPVVESDFRKTVQILRSAGFDLAHVELDDPAGSNPKASFLHQLAKSPNPAQLEILAIALELGLDAQTRRYPDKPPASLIVDEERRHRWISLEQSHAARERARSALMEIENEMSVQASKPPRTM